MVVIMKMEKARIALLAVTVALVLSLGYIAMTEYQRVMTQEQFSAYQQGVQIGYQEAVRQLLEQASTCQQVPVTMNNLTLNLIAVE